MGTRTSNEQVLAAITEGNTAIVAGLQALAEAIAGQSRLQPSAETDRKVDAARKESSENDPGTVGELPTVPWLRTKSPTIEPRGWKADAAACVCAKAKTWAEAKGEQGNVAIVALKGRSGRLYARFFRKQTKANRNMVGIITTV